MNERWRNSRESSPSRLYRFSSGGRAGVLLGMSLRQALPIVIGVLFLTVMLMAQLPLIGLLGPLAGCIVSFGRWHRAPLFEAAVPGVAMTWARWRKRSTWTRSSLTGSNSESIDDLPAAMSGLELLEVVDNFLAQQRSIGVIADRRAGTLSLVLAVRGSGFPVASLVRAGRPRRRLGKRARPSGAGSLSGLSCDLAGMDASGRHGRASPVPRVSTRRSRRDECCWRLRTAAGRAVAVHDCARSAADDHRRPASSSGSKRCRRRAGGRRRTDRRGAPAGCSPRDSRDLGAWTVVACGDSAGRSVPLGSHAGVGAALGRVVAGSCHTPARPPVGTDGCRAGLAACPS